MIAPIRDTGAPACPATDDVSSANRTLLCPQVIHMFCG